MQKKCQWCRSVQGINNLLLFISFDTFPAWITSQLLFYNLENEVMLTLKCQIFCTYFHLCQNADQKLVIFLYHYARPGLNSITGQHKFGNLTSQTFAGWSNRLASWLVRPPILDTILNIMSNIPFQTNLVNYL